VLSSRPEIREVIVTRPLLAAGLVLALGAAAGAGDDVPKLLKTLARDKSAQDRAFAARRLGDLKAAEAVPALTAALKDKAAEVRWSAAGALLDLGEAARPAMPALQEALLDSDSTTVWNAAATLHNLGVVTTDLMPAYRRLLQDRDCDMQVSAAAAISEYAAPEELLPIAVGCRKAREGDFNTAGDARKLMAEIAKNPAAVRVLVESLADRDPEIREWAAKSLGEHRPSIAKSAIPALESAMEDESEAVRHAAARALYKLRDKK
jgi:HEAT repeat protein